MTAEDVKKWANNETIEIMEEVSSKSDKVSTSVVPQRNSDGSSTNSINKFGYFWRSTFVLFCLYCFICSLDLLSLAFRLLGGESAGKIFKNNEAINNPMAGLMIGILVTVLVQSSSTFSSIVVAMVASGMLSVVQTVPMIMGANIGTSVTNTIVSLTQFQDTAMFERSFSAATVHDIFNILTVAILLPVEVLFHPLVHISRKMVEMFRLSEENEVEVKLLSRITDPLTEKIVLVDKNVIKQIAIGSEPNPIQPLLQRYCLKNYSTHESEWELCDSLFSQFKISDAVAGTILLLLSLLTLFVCLLLLVKMLKPIFQGQISSMIRRTMKTDFPGCLKNLTGYATILVGVGLTILVQSSSILTSTLTPLVGLEIVSLERAYALTLGSNVGTTVTSLLAALTAQGEEFQYAVQISFCHLLFNLLGIALWYPVPFMRKVPLKCAARLGKTTSTYPWFAFVFILLMFFVVPGSVLGLSVVNSYAVISLLGLVVTLLLSILLLNYLQKNHGHWLPTSFQTWDFLPKWVRSLSPYHDFLLKLLHELKELKRKFENSFNVYVFEQRQERPVVLPVKFTKTGSINYGFAHEDVTRKVPSDECSRRAI